jgi:hypothetical protein
LSTPARARRAPTHTREGIDVEITANRLLIPYDEAMRLLGGIGRTKFYDLIDTHQIVRVSIGRRGFITAKSLELYVDSLEADGQLTP